MKTAVIVAGAGAMGWFEAVGLKALYDLKLITYDYLVATSSGGSNAAMFHAGQIDSLIEMWMTIKNHDVFTENFLEAIGPAGCFCDNKPLRKLITKSVDFKALRANPIPLIVNIANLYTSELEKINVSALDDQDMIDALVQTAAIPVLFPQINGRVDGGILCDFPISEVLLDGVDRIIVFSGLFATKPKLNNAIEVAAAAINTMLLSSLVNGMQAVAAMNQIREKPIELVMIQPQKDYGIGLIDFNGLGNRENRKKLFTEAYDLTMAQLNTLVA